MIKTILLSAIILNSLFAYSQSAKAIMNYEKGTEALESRKYQDAIRLLTLSLNETPTTDAFYNRALAYYLSGDSCSFCNDLKSASIMNDSAAENLYREHCFYTFCTSNIPDSIKLRYPNIRSIQIVHHKCNSDSTIKYIYEDEEKAAFVAESEETDTLSDYLIVETPPVFPGGDKARMIFLQNNMKYPHEAREGGVQGVVYVTFSVETDGSITEIKVLRSPGNSLSNEAIRVVKLMPKWKPGTQKGKPVRVQFNMPMKFTLGK